MKNMNEIKIIGYNEMVIQGDADGFINSEDIYTVGKEYGKDIKVSDVIRKRAIIEDILFEYILGVDEGDYPNEGTIANDYMNEWNGITDKGDDWLVLKDKIINKHVNRILEKYKSKNGNYYRTAALLETIPGFVKKHNYGGSRGQVIFYNKVVSLIIAAFYSYGLKQKIYEYYTMSENMIVRLEEAKLEQEIECMKSYNLFKMGLSDLMVDEDQNIIDKTIATINTAIRERIGKKEDLGKGYKGMGYDETYNIMRSLSMRAIMDEIGKEIRKIERLPEPESLRVPTPDELVEISKEALKTVVLPDDDMLDLMDDAEKMIVKSLKMGGGNFTVNELVARFNKLRQQ